MTGLLKPDELGVVHVEKLQMPIAENWYGIETARGQLVPRIWKGEKEISKIENHKSVVKIIMPLVKAHTPAEAKRKIIEKQEEIRKAEELSELPF